jgi:hypothetical protein
VTDWNDSNDHKERDHETYRRVSAADDRDRIGIALPGASAETAVQSNIDVRTVVAVKVAEVEAQRWLTGPWQLNPVASGPNQGANFILVFYDRLLNLGGGGKPAGGGMDRALALVVPAKHPQTGDIVSYVVRVLTANPQALPGPTRTRSRRP